MILFDGTVGNGPGSLVVVMPNQVNECNREWVLKKSLRLAG